MRPKSFAPSVALLMAAATATAFDAVGTLKSVDLVKNAIEFHAGGKDRNARLAEGAKALGEDGKSLPDGFKSGPLKEGATATFSVELNGGAPTVTAVRLGKHAPAGKADGGKPGSKLVPKATTGLKPLTEMTAEDKYKGQDGGLYGGGKNEPTGAYLQAAGAETARIVPLDREGKPAASGKIGIVSLSMSNATMEFSAFKRLADASTKKSPRVAVVDCAQGGQAMAQWVDPKARPWVVAEKRLLEANVDPRQVQVAWVKLANVHPEGTLVEHVGKLQKDTAAVLRNAKAKFPNLRIAYLGSRIYAGHAATALNPEPYAYEGAFACRGLILAQIAGDADLNCDPGRGIAKAPLLLWGPYLWADGTTARKADGLVWELKDFAGDGTHPSEAGRKKVAEMLLRFFETDPLARTWFAE